MKLSIFGVSFLTMCFSILGVSQCSFMTAYTFTGAQQSLGLFSIASYDQVDGSVLGCIRFSNELELDTMFIFGRFFASLTAFCATLSFLLICFINGFKPSRTLWYVCRGLLIMSTLSQMFTYTTVGSSYCVAHGCRLTGVGILAIFNTFLLAGLAITVYLDKPPLHPLFVMWSDEFFLSNRDTLAMDEHTRVPEFSSSIDSSSETRSHASSMHEMEASPGKQKVAWPQSSVSVYSEQPSLQETLVSTGSVQRVTKFRFFLVFAITYVWLVSIVGVRRCTFILLGPIGSDRLYFRGVGLYTHAVYEEDGDLRGCLAYSDTERGNFSASFQAGRVFGAVSALLMTVVTLCVVIQLFCSIAKEEIWLFIRALLPFSLVSQLLAFVAFNMNECSESEGNECVPGGAGIMVILNVIIIAFLSVFACKLPPPSNPVFVKWQERQDESRENLQGFEMALPTKLGKLGVLEELDETENCSDDGVDLHEVNMHSEGTGPETITVRIEYDRGEKKTIKEVLHPDGSKTITTTIEEMDDISLGEVEPCDDDTISDVSGCRAID